MASLQVVTSHAGLLFFTVLTAAIIIYLLYALIHPERF
jgi:K+-transporting ATPase KdpF subunit